VLSQCGSASRKNRSKVGDNSWDLGRDMRQLLVGQKGTISGSKTEEDDKKR